MSLIVWRSLPIGYLRHRLGDKGLAGMTEARAAMRSRVRGGVEIGPETGRGHAGVPRKVPGKYEATAYPIGTLG